MERGSMISRSEDVVQSLVRTQGVGLRRVNGIGTALLGQYVDRELTGTYYAMVWFTLFFIPLVPIGIFLVGPGVDVKSGKPNGSIRFYGKMPAPSFQRLYPGALTGLLVSTVIQSLLFLVGFIVAIYVAYIAVSALHLHR